MHYISTNSSMKFHVSTLDCNSSWSLPSFPIKLRNRTLYNLQYWHTLYVSLFRRGFFFASQNCHFTVFFLPLSCTLKCWNYFLILYWKVFFLESIFFLRRTKLIYCLKSRIIMHSMIADWLILKRIANFPSVECSTFHSDRMIRRQPN